MNKKFFRTVLGDKPSADMGYTYSHEHIIIEESYPTSTNPNFLLNDIDKVAKELKGFYDARGRTMIDTMPANCGRNVIKLAQVSRLSNVNIIVPTGIHLEVYYPKFHWRYNYSEEALTELFISDIEDGIDKYDYSGPFVERTSFRAGVIKLATGDEKITTHQEKIFHAVVNTHLKTGAPILTHTNSGKLALEQAKLLEKLGANLKNVVLSHIDRNNDLDYHKSVLDMGVKVEYDSAFRWELQGKPNYTFSLLKRLLPLYPNQITLGMDMAKNEYWQSYGGNPGLNYLIKTIPGFLNSINLSEFHHKLFFDNPRELYTFSDKKV